MSKITLVRCAESLPGESILSSVRSFLFGLFDGWSKNDKKGWRKLWKRLMALEPGEFAVVEFVIPRSSPYHRRHFAIINAVFDAQERFTDFDVFIAWIKVGAAWVARLPTRPPALAGLREEGGSSIGRQTDCGRCRP